MSIHGQIITTALCLLVVAYVVALTVRGQLSERWCLLWIAAALIAALLVNAPGLLAWVTVLVGARYPASALTMVALFLLLLLAIHAGSEATVYSARIVSLTQQLALVRQALDEHLAAHGDTVGERLGRQAP